MPTRRRIHSTAIALDRRLDRRRRNSRGSVILAPYRGYGRRIPATPLLSTDSSLPVASGAEMIVRGRVLVDKLVTRAAEAEPLWRNVLNAYRRFHSSEVPGALVRASVANVVRETESDDEGYFDLTLVHSRETGDSLWQEVRLELPETGATAVAHVVLPPPEAEFAVISDIDDTIVQTGATSLLKMARSLVANAATRLPFDGVADLYRELHRDRNPLFYVSSSPWNLYDLLHDFMDLNRIPHGPMFLQDWGIDDSTLILASHERHKLAQIRSIIDFYPEMPFVLIGDSGQHDPEIYLQVIQAYPGRIRLAIIRDVTQDLRAQAVARIIADSNAAGVEMLHVRDSAEALVHLRRLGLA